MPPLPGEERVLTVYADVHYYFGPPTPKTSFHRFDKGSYLYVYYNATQRRSRVEIANNPGTPDQDAFNGALDQVLLRHSTNFPTLCTLIVEGFSQGSSHTSQRDQTQWLLPSGDPRDDGRRLYRLHTLDIYFWTQEDSNSFLDTIERYLSAGQLETDRLTQQSSEAGMSTVVKNLENMAVTDPTYQQGQFRNSQGGELASQQVPHSSSFHEANSDYRRSSKEQEQALGHAPVAYNPAAPAAPEPIQHREKTPPPPDAGNGTGLVAVEIADQGQYFVNSQPALPVGVAPTSGYQTSAGLAVQHGYASPPPSAGFPRHGSISSQPSVQAPLAIPSFAPPPTQIQNPNAHFLPQQSAVDQQHAAAGPGSQEEGHDVPLGGYSAYSYANPQQQLYQQQSHLYQGQQQQPQASEYDIHSHVYRPTEAEAHNHAQKHAKQAMKSTDSGRGYRLEKIASGVDRRVGHFLSLVEKKIG